MSRHATFKALAALAWLLPVLVGGCTSNSSVQKPTAPAIQPVSLPDLSRMTEPVRRQINERYSALTLTMHNPGASAIDLSNAYGDVGKILMAAELPDAAELYYVDAQALAPTDVRWPYYLGHLYRKRGTLAQSAASFERALQLRFDDQATAVWLGDVYLKQGRPEAAEPLLAKALSLQPGSVAARFGLGRAALARKDYTRAVMHLEEALRLDQAAAAVHYPLAMAYRGLGDVEKAETHLHLRPRDEVEIRPADPLIDELNELMQNALAYEVRGTRALDSRDWASAASYFRKGVELAPANPALRHRLGTALFMMGDAKGAVQQFEEALRVSPEYAKAHYSLGVIMEASGRDKDAIDRLSAAVKLAPSYAEARLRLAAIFRRTGRLQESLAQYDAIIKSDPRVAEAAFGYAMILVRLRRYAEARDRLAAGINVYRDQPGFAHALARVLAAAPDEGVRDGRRALAVMQTLSDQQRRMDMGETMAMTLAELGRYDEATMWQRDAIAAAKRAGQAALATHMVGNLKLYESRRPCRTPWREGEMP